MQLYDQHLHSRHSMDSKADPRENVESALSKGLTGLTFTEHFDTHPDDWTGCVYDDAEYSDTIAMLRDRYGERIFVGKGIEICYQPSRMDFILDFLATHEFDLVLLSVHYFGDRGLHVRDNWNDVSIEDGTRQYLEYVVDAVRHCARIHKELGRTFDVVGHLDLVKRYTHKWFKRSAVHKFPKLIDDILHACLDADLIPEINTSSLRRGLGETMPAPAVVKRYAQLGGAVMSLGSDAHVSSDIGTGFDTAIDMLRAAGIGHTAWFHNRERVTVPV